MSDEIAIVTGSNKGIGFGIVKGLCEKFNGIVYLTARDIERGETAIKELKKLGFSPRFHQLDITDPVSVDRFRDYIQEKYGGLNILVNNAAIAFKQAATDPFEVQAETTIDVNYFGLLRVCKAFFPLLRPGARVVNVSSSCGHLSRIPGEEIRKKLRDKNLTEDQLSSLMNDFVTSAKNGTNSEDGWGTSAYNVSKNGVSALTFIQQKQFDLDTRRPDIMVNAVHPGYVDTDMTSHKGDLTIEEGADAPIFLSLLKPEDNIKGCYVWKDRRIVDWLAPDTPARY